MPTVFYVIWFVGVVLLCWWHMDLPGTGFLWVVAGVLLNGGAAIGVAVMTRPSALSAPFTHTQLWFTMFGCLAIGAAVAGIRRGISDVRWG